MSDPVTASGASSSDDSNNTVSWGRRLLIATILLAAVVSMALPRSSPEAAPPVLDDATRRWRIVQQEFSLADLPPGGQVLNSGKDYSLFSGTMFLLILSFPSRAELDAFRNASPLLSNATPQKTYTVEEQLVTVFPGSKDKSSDAEQNTTQDSDLDPRWNITYDHFIGYSEWPWFAPSIRDGVHYHIYLREKRRFAVHCDLMFDFDKHLIYVKFYED